MFLNNILEGAQNAHLLRLGSYDWGQIPMMLGYLEISNPTYLIDFKI